MCCNHFSLGERGVCLCVCVCGWSFALVDLFSHTCIRTLVFNILLKRFYRDSRLRCCCSTAQTAGFMIISSNGLLFLSGVVHFLPRDDLHTEPAAASEREKETDVYVYCCVPGRESGEHKNISTLAPRLRLARVFSVASICCIYMRLPHFLPCSLHFSLRA